MIQPATNQRGFVSLLTVSIISLLIVILTVAMVRLMSGELLQSTDSVDSIKAYYTSQGVAEYTAWQFRSELASGTTNPSSLNQGCGAANANADYDPAHATVPLNLIAGASVTCTQVTATTNEVEASASQNQTNTYDLTDSVLAQNGYIHRLVITWDDGGVSGPQGSFMDPDTGTAWSTSDPKQPPVMEIGITNYYPGQQTAVSGSYYPEIYLVPTTSAGNSPLQYDSLTTPVQNIQCSSGSAPRCSAEIDAIVPAPIAQYRTVVTVTPLFHDAQYSLTAYAVNPATISPFPTGIACPQDNNNNEGEGDCLAPISADDATIDVTTSVGQTNRRVEFSVPVRSEPQINEVLEGDNDICKSFNILTIPGYSQVVQPDPATKPDCAISP